MRRGIFRKLLAHGGGGGNRECHTPYKIEGELSGRGKCPGETCPGDYVQGEMSPDPQRRSFHAIAPWAICASWHQNRLILFKNILFITSVSDRRTDGRTNIQAENIVSLPNSSLFWAQHICICGRNYLHPHKGVFNSSKFSVHPTKIRPPWGVKHLHPLDLGIIGLMACKCNHAIISRN